jgi:hypothetical protein
LDNTSTSSQSFQKPRIHYTQVNKEQIKHLLDTLLKLNHFEFQQGIFTFKFNSALQEFNTLVAKRLLDYLAIENINIIEIETSLKTLFLEKVWQLKVRYDYTYYNNTRADGACLVYSHYQIYKSIIDNINNWHTVPIDDYKMFWTDILPVEINKLIAKAGTLDPKPNFIDECIDYLSRIVTLSKGNNEILIYM